MITQKQEENIYIEETVRIIRPLKVRIFNEDLEKYEHYGEDKIKVILLRQKTCGSKTIEENK